jgi:hypothetical protein
MPPVRLTDSELDAVFAAPARWILTVAMVFCRRSRMRCNRTARGGLDPVTLPWQHMPHGSKPNPCREAAALSRPAQGGDANES